MSFYGALHQVIAAGITLHGRRPSGLAVEISRVVAAAPLGGVWWRIAADGWRAYYQSPEEAVPAFARWCAGGAWFALVRLGDVELLVDGINDAGFDDINAAAVALGRGESLRADLGNGLELVAAPVGGDTLVGIGREIYFAGDSFDAARFWLNAAGPWRSPPRYRRRRSAGY